MPLHTIEFTKAALTRAELAEMAIAEAEKPTKPGIHIPLEVIADFEATHPTAILMNHFAEEVLHPLMFTIANNSAHHFTAIDLARIRDTLNRTVPDPITAAVIDSDTVTAYTEQGGNVFELSAVL